MLENFTISSCSIISKIELINLMIGERRCSTRSKLHYIFEEGMMRQIFLWNSALLWMLLQIYNFLQDHDRNFSLWCTSQTPFATILFMLQCKIIFANCLLLTHFVPKENQALLAPYRSINFQGREHIMSQRRKKLTLRVATWSYYKTT
jgi:hypothetical protein